ncbi:hypothetical protein BDZ91DRAFT_88058 [Kalaharituber pfeilii]|nr:hypothetical protein BDZ91DRAFT_88058 [Kalaharituber pfeilii]
MMIFLCYLWIWGLFQGKGVFRCGMCIFRLSWRIWRLGRTEVNSILFYISTGCLGNGGEGGEGGARVESNHRERLCMWGRNGIGFGYGTTETDRGLGNA